MNVTSIDSGYGLSRYFVGIHKWENGAVNVICFCWINQVDSLVQLKTMSRLDVIIEKRLSRRASFPKA